MSKSIHDNPELQKEVADAVHENHDFTVTAEDVLDVARYGTVQESVVGSEYDDRVSEAILAELDKRGIQT